MAVIDIPGDLHDISITGYGGVREKQYLFYIKFGDFVVASLEIHKARQPVYNQFCSTRIPIRSRSEARL